MGFYRNNLNEVCNNLYTMDVLLENIRAIIHILDETTDDTELMSIMDSFNSLNMNAKMNISTCIGTDYDDYDIEAETLEVVLDDDVCFIVSKYFTNWYDGVRYFKRCDGGYTIGYIDIDDRDIYKKNYHDVNWVGNDHYNSHPKELTIDEKCLICILNSTIPDRWYRWFYNDFM